jgi:hypothetical protein
VNKEKRKNKKNKKAFLTSLFLHQIVSHLLQHNQTNQRLTHPSSPASPLQTQTPAQSKIFFFTFLFASIGRFFFGAPQIPSLSFLLSPPTPSAQSSFRVL